MNEEMDWYPSENKPVIDENTSDGYHTFKELYEMRLLLTAGYFNLMALAGERVYRSKKHSDGSIPFGGGWFIVVAQLKNIGQISFHYELKDWDLFGDVWEVDLPPEYDGHTTADVADRLRTFLERSVGTEIVVIFGDGAIRHHYIQKNHADPEYVIPANHPELLNVDRVRGAKTIKVIRYPEKYWEWTKGADFHQIRETENLLSEFKANGMNVIEVLW